MITLADFTKSPRAPLSKKQLHRIQKWLDADWESHDIDRDVVTLIRRLLITINRKTSVLEINEQAE